MAKFHLGDLELMSPAFEHGSRIPDAHTCNGEDVSPALEWTGAPDDTVQFAIICHDPDAPLTYGWTHWVVWGIPGDATGIAQGGGAAFSQGTNDFETQDYGGPAPPPGHGTHYYFFHLYALNGEVDAGPETTMAGLLEKMDPLITAQARLVGTYER